MVILHRKRAISDRLYIFATNRFWVMLMDIWYLHIPLTTLFEALYILGQYISKSRNKNIVSLAIPVQLVYPQTSLRPCFELKERRGLNAAQVVQACLSKQDVHACLSRRIYSTLRKQQIRHENVLFKQRTSPAEVDYSLGNLYNAWHLLTRTAIHDRSS